MKKHMNKRIVALVLSFVMILGMLPMSSLTAFAADTPTEKNIMLGASHIEGAQASNVYFGTYKQSSDGNGGYNIDPIKWRVLSNADGRLFLLSDQNLDVFEYHKEYEAVTWETSTMRSWLNGLANNKGNGENAIDYTKDNFLDTAFSASEQTAIADTTVVNNDNPQYGTDGGNNTTDKVFLLSIEEAQNTAYGFTNNTNSTDTRKATNTAYVADGGKLGGRMYGVGVADYWWLRSSGLSTNSAALVGSNGHVGVTGYNVSRNDCAVRPAFNINLDSVLFTSAAKDGKSSTAAVGGGAEIFENVDISTLTDNDGYKLTLLDSNRNAFEATLSSISGNTVTVSYSGAKTGDNEYISAIIKNGSTVKYYGRLGLASESGTATVTLPDDFNAANGDVLCIFNEQYNGDYKTDYASELIEIGYKVSFDANGGTGTMDGVIAKLGADYPLPANGFDAPNGYKFSGWATTASGDIITTDTITITANTTLYAVWEMLPAEAPTVEASSNLTLTYKGYTDQSVSVSVTEKSGYTYSYQWYDGNGQPINGATSSTYTVPGDLTVGSYSYYCRVTTERIDNELTNSADSAKITVTVNKATPGVTAPTAQENLVYNGSEQELISAGSATNGTMQYALGTADAVTGAWETDIPKATKAGTYYVWYKVVGNDNYNDVEPVCIAVTVAKAKITVKADDKSKTYGDTEPTLTYTVDESTPLVSGESLSGISVNRVSGEDANTYTITASEAEGANPNYDITFVDGTLSISPKPITVTIQNATSIYGEVLAELKATDEGIINGDANVYSIATTATSTSNVGKYAITGTALDSNYEVIFANGEYEITEREITITVEAKNTIVNTALPTYTYKVEGLVGEDKLVTEPTLTSDADITVIGEYEITATGADAGNNYSIKYVPANLTVLTDDAVDAAAGYAEELKDYDPATVTSEDKAELEEMLSEIDTILADETTTDNGKKALEEVKEQVENLIKEITDAEAATDTENTEKVKDVTAENVTPDDKTDLEKAKDDLENALEEYGDNYTEDEKKAIEDEIKRIDDALEVIGNVEAVEELIDKLPENITKNDEAAIKAADDAYNALTDYEKSLVDEDAKKALDDAKAALAELNKPADTTSPNTGDNSNMFLWIALLFISGGAVITLTVVDRKRKAVKR